MNVTIEAKGITGDERELARAYVNVRLQECDGRIKQFYLANRQGSDVGIVSFTSQTEWLAPDMIVRYVRNGVLERLDIKVNATGFIEELREKPPQPIVPMVEIMWLIDTTGSTNEGENAPIKLFETRQISKQLKEEYGTPKNLVAFRFGIASVGDFPYPEDNFSNPYPEDDDDVPYTLNAPLGSDPSSFSLTANDGYDTPEAQLNAIAECIADYKAGWTQGAIRICVLATDAAWHQPPDLDLPYISQATLLGILASTKTYLMVAGSTSTISSEYAETIDAPPGETRTWARLALRQIALYLKQRTLLEPSDLTILT